MLTSFLVIVGLAAVIGMAVLWPQPAELERAIVPLEDPPGVSYHDGHILQLTRGCEGVADPANCYLAEVLLLDGEQAEQTVQIELVGPQAMSGLRVGDVVEVARVPTPDGVFYSYTGTNRLGALLWLTMLFVVAVLAVARLRGLTALLGLVISGFVLTGFMLPALIVGRPGIPVALAGSTAILFVVLYVAHGVSMRTSTALAGTILGLAVTTGLGMVAVHAARLSGFADESDFELLRFVGGLNFQELLMSAIIIGGLGVLNDVTITQASAVWELRAAAPELSRRQLFAAGMRIGRDHIASSIYTVVFAYAGGSLTVLLLLHFANRGGLDLFGAEMFASEAVRTLASAIGLVLSVPITTGLAAVSVVGASPKAG